MGTSYFTVCDEITVAAAEDCRPYGKPIGPTVEVSFPDREWDRVTIYRRFATVDEAREAGKALASALRSLAPRGTTGFYSIPRLNRGEAAMVSAREAIERHVRGWMGEGAVVVAVND